MCLLSPVDGGEDDGGDDGVTTVAVLSVVEDNLEGVFDVDTVGMVSVDTDGVVTTGGWPASTSTTASVVALFIVIVVVVARVRARIRWILMRTQRSKAARARRNME